MKKDEMKKLDATALKTAIRTMMVDYAKMKFLAKTGKETNTSKIRSVRRNIARLNTFLNAQ